MTIAGGQSIDRHRVVRTRERENLVDVGRQPRPGTAGSSTTSRSAGGCVLAASGGVIASARAMAVTVVRSAELGASTPSNVANVSFPEIDCQLSGA